MDDPSVKDAWEQQHELLERFTTELKIREDLKVVGHGIQRGVEVFIGELNKDVHTRDKQRFYWHSTGKRTVGTIREFAKALLEACDFVDESNPTWAKSSWVGLVNGPVVNE